MIPLVDGDILAYEIPFACEYNKEEVPGWDYVSKVLESRLQGICEAVQATAPPKIFLTGEGNFREEVAVSKPYKGNRSGEKPFHYENIRTILRHSYGAEVVEGFEADDAMAFTQTEAIRASATGEEGRHASPTVICTRDKDLLMVPGFHYGWESGKQGERELHEVSSFGRLYQTPKKIQGEGIIFFYYQMLIGDSVDNIPGCKGIGPKNAIRILDAATTALEAEQLVWDVYKLKMDDKSLEELRDYFIEQGRLLWMIKERDAHGNLVHWEPSIELTGEEDE